jgi:alpha-glucosidase
VRGAIIPSGPLLQSGEERLLDRLTLDIYPDDDGAAAGQLYEDDGASFAYEQGYFCRTFYQCRVDQSRRVLVLLARREGAYEPAVRSVEIRLHGAGELQFAELPSDEGDWQVKLRL